MIINWLTKIIIQNQKSKIQIYNLITTGRFDKMRSYQDRQRSRQHNFSYTQRSTYHSKKDKNNNQDNNDANIPNIIQIYNIPQHYNEGDISYFIFKNLDNVKGLVKKSLNPIIKSQYIPQKNCISLQFRTREEALNCLQLNGIYYGNRSFYMKSKLQPRKINKLDTKNIRIRIVGNKVEDGFCKIFIGNLPQMQEYQLIDILSQVGQLKAVQNITTNKAQVQFYCQFKNRQKTDQYLSKLNQLKIKNRAIIAKRAALMSSQTSKSKIVRARRSMFESDLNTFYLTLDVDGYFKNMKISCVLLLKNIISSFIYKDEIMRDIRKEVSKIGPVVKMVDYQKNIYIQFQKVQYAQIAYLLVSQRKFQGKSIDISFYDPIHFADQLLC